MTSNVAYHIQNPDHPGRLLELSEGNGQRKFFVGIITYNRADRLRRIVYNKAFWEAMTSVNGHVVFLNPGSVDDTQVVLDAIAARDDVTVRLTQDVNLVACRMRITDIVFGMGIGPDDVFLFLDDDAVVNSPEAFLYIRDIFNQSDVGVAGQEAFFMDAGVTRFSRADSQVPCEVDTVSGSVQAIRGQLLLEGVDYNQDYQPCWHEDTDLCFQAKALGWKIWGFSRGIGITHDSHRKTPDTVYYRNMMFLSARWGNKGLTVGENYDEFDSSPEI